MSKTGNIRILIIHLFFLFLMVFGKVLAQAPSKISYQAVVRNGAGDLLVNSSIGVKISFLQGSLNGNAVYTEIYSPNPQTNAQGLLSFEVGSGMPITGTFDSIDWAAGPYFIRTEVDIAGGSNYQILGSQQLLSVPYALHAKTADVPGLPGPQGPPGFLMPGSRNGDIAWWNGTNWVFLEAGNINQVLTICNGVPTWGPCTGSNVLPTVVTNAIRSIGGNSVEFGGLLTHDGGNTITARGVAYGLGRNPDLSGTSLSMGTGIGVFSGITQSLLPSSTYYARAFATSSAGTAYGNEVVYTTLTSTGHNACPGQPTITDIDGNIYNTVQIGSQCWIQSNLKVTKYTNGDPLVANPGLNWGNTYSGAYGIYDNNLQNDFIYGKLYNGYAVEDYRGLCPTGWHVPSDGEWRTLVSYFDSTSIAPIHPQAGLESPTAGGALKSLSLWDTVNVGATNAAGFSALPGGWIEWNTGVSGQQGGTINQSGSWWSSTIATSGPFPGARITRRILNNSSAINKEQAWNLWGHSVRCLQDQSPNVSTLPVDSIRSNSVRVTGIIKFNGGRSISSRGFVYASTPNPTLSNASTVVGAGTDSFTSSITGLSASTTYYLRAYATNSVGTSYGNEIVFGTLTASGHLSCSGSPKVIDIDGNLYNTVQIGAQCWTQSNLKTSRYRNGDSIPMGNHLSNSDWWDLTTGSYSVLNDVLYGKLYNYFAATDTRGICPTGWRVPSHSEMNQLVKFLDSNADTATTNMQSAIAGSAMKSSITQPTPGGWPQGNVWTNASGFSALPGGGRDIYGIGMHPNARAHFWTTTSATNNQAYLRELTDFYASISSYTLLRSHGLSIRCLKDQVPGVSTGPVDSIRTSSARVSGTVTTNGGLTVTSRGVVFGTRTNPTLNNSSVQSGQGLGSFYSNITGLVASTTYYVRAYAQNAMGVAYGPEVSFQTLPISCPGTPTVTDVDGNSYTTVQIGSQCWMNSNLRVTKYNNGNAIPTGLSNADWTSTTAGAYHQQQTGNLQDSLWGKLYNALAVIDQRGLCPAGWSVPSDADWTRLVKQVDPAYDTSTGNSSTGGGALKSTISWALPNTGATNSSGFQAVGSGGRTNNTGSVHGYVGYSAEWWSSTPKDNNYDYWGRFLRFDNAAVIRGWLPKGYGIPVRCIKKNSPVLKTEYVTGITSNEAVVVSKLLSNGGTPVSVRGVAYSTSPLPTLVNDTLNSVVGIGDYSLHIRGLQSSTTYFVRAFAINSEGVVYGNEISFSTRTSNGFSSCGGVADLNGNSYQTVQIGTQCWTQSNLKVNKYRNGDSIPQGLTSAQWSSTTSGAYAIFNNNTSSDSLYGKLYNWFAVNDSRGLCPTGWHVPSDAEWTTLITFLGGVSTAGGLMKSTITQPTPGGWNSPNTGATNSSGFSGLPGGLRHYDGVFWAVLGHDGAWWSSTNAGSGQALGRFLNANNTGANSYNAQGHHRGFSVRCLRD